MAEEAEPLPLDGKPDPETVAHAETLLNSLTGILSARMVAAPDGMIEEIHVLTTEEVAPKQTVRNVESALLAHFDLPVDHRKISVARTSDEGSVEGEVLPQPPRKIQEAGNHRLLFVDYRRWSESPHRVRAEVTVEWKGERFIGEAVAADLPRSRLEAFATAALRGIEEAIQPKLDEEERDGVTLALDGVKVLEAFDQDYVLVAVHAIQGRSVVHLAGAAIVEKTSEQAAVMAAFQASDRWVRGR